MIKKHKSKSGFFIRLNSLSDRTFVLLLFAITFIVYSPGLVNDFVYDDYIVIKRENESLSFGSIAHVFTESHYPYLSYYRPITRLTFVFQNALFSDSSALSYHLVNNIIAGLLSVFVFKLFRKVFPTISPSLLFAGVLLFSLHPVTSSSVYPAASGRETLLPVLCIVLSLYFFLQRGLWMYVLSVICFGLAIFGKEQAVILPVILFLADLTIHDQNNKKDWFKRALTQMPFIIIMGVYFFVRWQIFKGQEYTFSHQYFLTLSMPFYALQQIILPNISLHYEPMTISSWFSWWKLIAVGCVGLISSLQLRRVWNKQKNTYSYSVEYFF